MIPSVTSVAIRRDPRSAIRQLLGAPGLARRLDDAAVARYLAGLPSEPGGTFFDGVHRLPAGHWLEVGRAGVELG